MQIVSIVGGETLLGRELQEALEQRHMTANVQLLGMSEEAAVLTGDVNEPTVIAALEKGRLMESRLVFLAGSATSSRRSFELVQEQTEAPVLVDLRYELEDEPDARLRAPIIEPEGFAVAPGSIHVIAHPAAVVLAAILSRLHKAHPIQRSVVQVFEPASERGQAGLNELQQQSVGLLAFKKLQKEVFDAQLAYNMLPRLGAEAQRPIEEVELRIDRHLASLLSGGVPQPSLRLIQAPVFHGYSFSLWVEFAENPGVVRAGESLATALIEVRTGDEELPTNVGVAGQDGISVGAMEVDRNNARAMWVWAVADNLRISAQNAKLVAEELL